MDKDKAEAIIRELRENGADEATLALVSANLGLTVAAVANATDAADAATANNAILLSSAAGIDTAALPIVASMPASSDDLSAVAAAGPVGDLPADPSLQPQPRPAALELQGLLARIGAAEAGLATLADAVGLGDTVRKLESQLHDRVAWLEAEFERMFSRSRPPPVPPSAPAP